MKKRLLLLSMLLIACMGTLSARNVIIGKETNTKSTLPFHMLYNYSLTQQIYTADEIGTGGEITSISFYYAYTQKLELYNIKVYLKEVEKSSFSGPSDFVPIDEEADLVFEGDIEVSGPGWVTIELSSPFTYSGIQNLMVCCYDPEYKYPGSSYTFNCSNTSDYTSLSYHSDSDCLDLYNLGSYSGPKYTYRYRNNIKIGIKPFSVFTPHTPQMTISEITPYSATVSWTSKEPIVDLQYIQRPEGYGEWLHYDKEDVDEESLSRIGYENDTFSWGVMFPAGSFGSGMLKEVSIYDCSEMAGTISIYNAGEKGPSGKPLKSKKITLTGAQEFVTFPFYVPLDETKNVWVIIDTDDGNISPAAASENNDGDPNGRWISFGGDWMDLSQYDSSYSNVVFMVRALIGEDMESYSWNDVPNPTSPYKMMNLSVNTPYVVRVKTDDGDSNWVTKSFVTLSDNPVPFDMTAKSEANEATISWMGYSTEYNIRYRRAAQEKKLFFDDFENDMSQWTTIRNGGGEDDTDWHQVDPRNIWGDAYEAHSGSHTAVTRSYHYLGFDVDNWLITQEVTLDGTLKFWVFDDGTFHEHYDVYVSTTTNDISAFTLFYEPGDASKVWQEVTVDLSSFHGQKGYIALRNTDYDQNFLLLDDFGIYGKSISAGDWISRTAQENSIVIMGLPPLTTYEYQIQGVKGSETSDWSPIAQFTTLNGESIGVTTGEALLGDKVQSSNQSDNWFSLDGQRLSGKPSKKGIYIHNGRKAILK